MDTGMPPSQPIDDRPDVIPADVRARVMPAALDELARWGVERFSVEAMAERHRLDPMLVYRYWGNRQRLIVDAGLADAETFSVETDTGSLAGDLLELARNLCKRLNTEEGRTYVRAMAMTRRGHHDDETRMRLWRARFAAVRVVIDRARERGELREGVNTLAAVQIVLAPLNIRVLYSDAVIDDQYCVAIADMAWHALARK